MTRRSIAIVAVAVALAGACSDPGRSADAFCERLAEATGIGGAEVAFGAGDPQRLDAVVAELAELLDRAPDEISTTTATLVEFFEEYRRAPRDQRRDLLAANEQLLLRASQQLDDYALDECGLFLQRAVPTPIPTADPGIEIAPE